MGDEKKKILVAEDDPGSLKILETLLTKWGYAVIPVSNGSKGWEVFNADPDINIVISDWMMPDIDGVEFCRLIRSAENRKYTYFIMLTAKTQVDDVVEGMESGADDFVTKPFNQFELKSRIHAGERVTKLESRLADKIQELSSAYVQLSSGLAAAASIQQSILPPKSGKMNGIGFSSCYIPSEDLSGDLFNIVPLRGNCLGIYIFDVSGHGVPAALQSVALGRLLTTYDPRSSLLVDPGPDEIAPIVVPSYEVVSRLNSQFQSASSKGDFITFLYGVLDTATGRFSYTRAGHPAPMLISRGKVKSIDDVGDIPVGIVPRYKYIENILDLIKGDRLFFFTDGITESVKQNGDRFSEERLAKILTSSFDKTIEESIDSLEKALLEWHGKPASNDDMSILGIELQ